MGSVPFHIYDFCGELERTLELGRVETGYYLSRERAAYWDGRNRHGASSASGVYFVELHAGATRAARRSVLRK